MKQTVVFDFDGVIHSYSSGWKGADVIPDAPVLGIKEAIAEIRSAGYEVVVVSTRCATEKGYGAVRAWLFDNEIEVDGVKTEKPPAIVYIDDRAICFNGKPDILLEEIKSFEPWYKARRLSNADRIRAMSDEELAVMFADHENKVAFEVCCSFGLPSVDYDFEEATSELLEWLKEPAEDTE